ncbi:hypothetical protein [Zhihengliuella sp.]|uniref:hypothetical protein n=1 Tax=Zhihengliuella sp. TaxID=1954483 RepID=UPI002811D998|nr:hypothetical protein [Zhihengliuella sp.]
MTTTPKIPDELVDAGARAINAVAVSYGAVDAPDTWTEESRAALTAAWAHLHPAPALGDVHAERLRQDAKWGEQNHPDGTGSSSKPLAAMAASGVTADWLADSATLATDTAAERGVVTWRHILLEEVFEALAESDPAKLRTELIQVAAVATQWAEAIDRRGDAQ